LPSLAAIGAFQELDCVLIKDQARVYGSDSEGFGLLLPTGTGMRADLSSGLKVLLDFFHPTLDLKPFFPFVFQSTIGPFLHFGHHFYRRPALGHREEARTVINDVLFLPKKGAGRG
jgi:hypothetical protein